MRITLPFLLSLLLATAGCTAAPDLEAERTALLNADRAFARATAERGVEGWVEYFDQNGSMFPAGASVTTGREAIRALMAPAFETPGYSLVWEPQGAQVSSSADLGYTFGFYQATRLDAEGNPVTSHGKYVSIWTKQDDGSWRVVVDIGNAGPEPSEDEPPAG